MLAGGYAVDVADTVDIHIATIDAMLKASRHAETADGSGHEVHEDHEVTKTDFVLGALVSFVVFVVAAVGPSQSSQFRRRKFRSA